MSFVAVLVIFLVLAAVLGGVGQFRSMGWVGWSPLGFFLLYIFVLFLTGNLPVGAGGR